jgi:hypothetical protein
MPPKKKIETTTSEEQKFIDDIFQKFDDEDYEAVDELLEHFHDKLPPYIRNSSGQNLLEYLIENFSPFKYIELLLEKGAAFNYKNKDGDTPFVFSLRKKNFDAMRLLIQYDAEISEVPKRWNKRKFERAIELIKKYAPVEFLDDDGGALCPIDWTKVTPKTLAQLGPLVTTYDEIAEFLNVIAGGEFLGEGSYGKVYRIDIRGWSYALKKSILESPRVKCAPLESYTAVDGSKVSFRTPAISIDEEAIGEYLIGKMAGELYTEGHSAHFIDTLVGGRILNSDDKQWEWRTLFPRLSGEIVEVFSEYFEDEDDPDFDYNYNVDMCIFSIIHALAVGQTRLGLVHNDLSNNNVMVETIRSHKPLFKKDGITYPISDFDYYRYVVTDDSLPESERTKIFEFDRAKVQYIAKIVAWGLACKYSTVDGRAPIISRHVQTDNDGYFGNYYHEAIDLAMLMQCIFKYDGGGIRTPFVREIAEWVYERVEGKTLEDKIESECDSAGLSDSSKRNNYTTFKTIFAGKTPREFFKQPFVQRFLKKNAVYHDAESNHSSTDSDNESASSGGNDDSQADSIEREMNTITLGTVEWTPELEKHLPINTLKKK